MIIRNCLTCKKEFKTYPSVKRRFCSHKCQLPWNKGKSWSEKMKKKISKSLKGKHCSPRTEFRKGYIMSQKHKKAMSLAMGGERNPFYGHKHTPEIMQKIIEANWKGEYATYASKHDYLTQKYGHPLFCESCGIKGEKVGRKWNVEWANKSGEYKRSLGDWLHLCPKCHAAYDRSGQMEAIIYK